MFMSERGGTTELYVKNRIQWVELSSKNSLVLTRPSQGRSQEFDLGSIRFN